MVDPRQVLNEEITKLHIGLEACREELDSADSNNVGRQVDLQQLISTILTKLDTLKNLKQKLGW